MMYALRNESQVSIFAEKLTPCRHYFISLYLNLLCTYYSRVESYFISTSQRMLARGFQLCTGLDQIFFLRSLYIHVEQRPHHICSSQPIPPSYKLYSFSLVTIASLVLRLCRHPQLHATACVLRLSVCLWPERKPIFIELLSQHAYGIEDIYFVELHRSISFSVSLCKSQS